MTAVLRVELTANFERNLEEIERFLADAEAPQAFDALLDELSDTVIPNLKRFPAMGRSFLQRPGNSVEAVTLQERLTAQLKGIAADGEIREYLMANYLLLYTHGKQTVYLLSIRHQRQLSFDFTALWGNR